MGNAHQYFEVRQSVHILSVCRACGAPHNFNLKLGTFGAAGGADHKEIHIFVAKINKQKCAYLAPSVQV